MIVTLNTSTYTKPYKNILESMILIGSMTLQSKLTSPTIMNYVWVFCWKVIVMLLCPYREVELESCMVVEMRDKCTTLFKVLLGWPITAIMLYWNMLALFCSTHISMVEFCVKLCSRCTCIESVVLEKDPSTCIVRVSASVHTCCVDIVHSDCWWCSCGGEERRL